MSAATVATVATTMTSREIAGLTGKKHMHVMRDCRMMFGALGIEAGGYIQDWIDPQNSRSYEEFALTRELTMTLITGYNVPLRHAVVKRWAQLEQGQLAQAAPQLPDFSDPVAAARAWANAKEAEQLAKCELLQVKPQAQALARLAGEGGAHTLRDAAKLLGVSERALIDWLLSDGMRWLYRDGKRRLQGYAHRLESGHVIHELRYLESREKHVSSVKLTPRGLARLAVLIEKRKGAPFLEKHPSKALPPPVK